MNLDVQNNGQASADGTWLNVVGDANAFRRLKGTENC
jgi:hypothetical protein